MNVTYYYVVMPITVILGEQRGDEGKGRFVDLLMSEHEIGARFNGGDNAGHTVVHGDEVYKLHGLPSSILHPHKKSVMGNGVVINPVRLTAEMDTLSAQGVEISAENLLISSGAHLTLQSHISEDEIRECGAGAQGSTRSGIAPVYASKALKLGVRAEIINNDLDGLFQIALDGLMAQRHLRVEAHLPNLDEERIATAFIKSAQRLGEFVTDTALFLNRELKKGTPILAEGAQAFLLDIDHGMYPFVTSSSTTSGGVVTGLGVPCEKYRVVGVSKAVQSHVGGGPFVTEINDPQILEKLHGKMSAVDAERGTTTGRTRRLGFLDLPAIKRSQMINGTDEMALTKLDWVPRFGKTIPICVAYVRKGKTLDIAPDAAYKLEQSTPVYQELSSWDEDVSHARRYKHLPPAAKKYLDFIEEQTQTPITFVGVGPERDQVVIR